MDNTNNQVSPHLRKTIDPRLNKALEKVDREVFVKSGQEGLVVGRSIPSTTTLQQIFSVLELPPRPKILQIGVGAGYASAVLSHVAAQVIGIEKSASLADAAVENLSSLNIRNVIVRHGEGAEGSSQYAPFDIIVISTPNIEDKSALFNQLTPFGQMLCIEYAESSLLKLIEYKGDGHNHYVRSEHGYIDFVQNKDEILIELGFINSDVLAKARQRANDNKTLIIDEVRHLTNVDDMALYRSLAKQYGVELGNVDSLLKLIDPTIFSHFSRAFLDHHHIIPLYIDNDILVVATSNPNASMAEIQLVFPHKKIKTILATPTDFRRLWSATDLCLQAQIPTIKLPQEPNEDKEEDDLLGQHKPEIGAHLVSLFEALLLDAVAGRASDIHLEQYGNEVRVRLRIDGEMRDVPYYNISPNELRGLINVIKLRAELNIAERRLPQGGRSRLRVGDSLFDLRVQVQPSLHSEHVVIRLLPQNSELFSIEKLGLSPGIAENYKRLLKNPAGLVLVVGPTGSGKSTTLYAGLQLLANDGSRKVITVEDPIEYSIRNIQQTRVRPDIGFNFADAMRSFVRQDPDIILVGEIRDHETSLEAIRASQTGHVVLSTLHCNDSVDAMQRLYDLGVNPNSLASELLAVIAQRLAKRICPHCREEAVPEIEILEEVFPKGTPNSFHAYAGKGCEQCNGTGTHGRVAVVEYLQINPELRNAISRNIPVSELRKLALDCGLVTMRDSALDHVIQGNIPLSELPRILPEERMAPEARWQWEKTS